MVVATDLDGTLTDYAEQLKPVLDALRAAGHTVVVLSGDRREPITDADWEFKRQRLEDLGLGDSYDRLVVVEGPEGCVPQRKVLWMKQNDCTVLIDNSAANARAATAAGILTLVPWATRILDA